ncbi:ABC transporter substrate-binding protein [Marinobacter sp.]|uniref:ABC transporter substrate-binding protein n=1 Tax=Marinobacter sp. TaxID=50741 RepID=UPI003A8CC849
MTQPVTRLKKKRTTGIALLCLGLFLLAFCHGAHAQGNGAGRTVYLVGSGNDALDQHLSTLLKAQLEDSIILIPVTEDQVATIEKSPVITIGTAAFSRVRQANRSAPVLAMLVEKSFISTFAERSPGQISGILYDVPLIRQALTGKAILPQATKIALLATADSVELYEPLIDELPAFGMAARIFLVESSDKLIPTLVRALGYSDFVLAAPDNAIYNPRTIKHILLTAYRRNQIVIGPTQAYVKAGSLASSYAPFPEMIELASSFLDTYFETGKFPPPSYPDEFRVEINKQVARSLNIPLPSREDIAARVDRQLSGNGEVSDD